MKAIKSILLGSAAGFVSVAAAQAADLPSRKAAPIEYVRVCDAYGSGFFYIPGTETCLRVGGAVVAEWRAYSTSYRNSRSIIGSNNPGTGIGFIPAVGNYSNARSGDNSAFSGTGRIELDARTGTGFGTLRTFLRLESTFGSGTSAATGSLGGGEYFGGANFGNGTIFRSPARETTILNKAFIQFAGLTAGRVQSFFDFYTDNVSWEVLRGSNATVGALAYTYTFGGGFSGSVSIEDNVSRRGIIGSTIGNFNYVGFNNGLVGAPFAAAGAAWGTRFFGIPDGAQIPEIVANLRYDAPWGAVQVSGAAHQIRTSLYTNGAAAANPTAYAIPADTQSDYGFAVQLGTQFLLDKVAPNVFSAGDKLWIQATYEQGAVGYVMGNNLSFNGGPVNANTFYGFGNGGVKASNGWDFNAFDCVWTAAGRCDKNEGWAVLAALKHYWTPTLSSGLVGSYLGLRYSNAALASFGGGVGAVNTDEYRVGTNLIWTPVKNFDIGGEVFYLRDNHLNRPVGLAPDFVMWAAGLPSWKGVNSTIEGRLRVQRSF
ncbi:MAG: porin [Methylocystaceae bacterium]|nr:MAG: porin [Methylocystaceae bacterium]